MAAEASWAITLPNQSAPLQQILEQGNNLQERQNEKLFSLYEKNQKEQESNDIFNIRNIREQVDPNKYLTGNVAIDKIAVTQISDLAKNLIQNHLHESRASVDELINDGMKDITSSHAVAKGINDNVQTTIKDIAKSNPNVDLAKLNQYGDLSVANSILNKDANGNISIKPPSLIQPPDLTHLNNPINLAKEGLIGNTNAIDKFYGSLSKEPFHNSTFESDKGFKTRDKFSGVLIPGITEVVPDANGKPTVQVSSQIVPSVKDANGNPLKIVSNNVFKRISSNNELYSSFYKEWLNSPDRKSLQQQYSKDNNGQSLDNHTDEIFFKNYLLDELNHNNPSYVSPDVAQVIPKQNININTGGVAQNFNDSYKRVLTLAQTKEHGRVPLNELDAEDQKNVLEYSNKLKPHGQFEQPLGQSDVGIVLRDGRLWIIDARDGSNIAPYSNLDANLPLNKGVKQTQKVLQDDKNKQAKQTSGVNWK